MESIKLALPLQKGDLANLECGQRVLLSGHMYTMRDAGHMRCMEMLKTDGRLPFDLEGQTLFFAGPTGPVPERPFGAIGPTTASRMDFATPDMMRAGIVATIGKGRRSDDVRQACKETGGVYFAAIGGIAALLAKCVTESKVIAWDDLGTEALRRIKVEDFPVYVGIDVKGNDIYGNICR